jgi:hypothetical protein
VVEPGSALGDVMGDELVVVGELTYEVDDPGRLGRERVVARVVTR